MIVRCSCGESADGTPDQLGHWVFTHATDDRRHYLIRLVPDAVIAVHTANTITAATAYLQGQSA